MPLKESAYPAIVRVLAAPLVRFCVRHSISFRILFEHARSLFVQEAHRQLLEAGESVNVSRIALRTGLSRREVQACLETKEVEIEPSLPRKVLGKWQEDRTFRGKNGKPRTLSVVGSESEFALLVRSVSKDLNPYSVLAELEAARLIAREGENVMLLSPVYTPVGDARKGFQLAAADIDDLILAVEENVRCSDEPPHVHIKTSYDNVVQEALPEVQEWLREQGKRLHREAREFLSKFDADINPSLKGKQAGGRVAIGSFSLIEAPPPSAESTQTASRTAESPKKRRRNA